MPYYDPTAPRPSKWRKIWIIVGSVVAVVLVVLVAAYLLTQTHLIPPVTQSVPPLVLPNGGNGTPTPLAQVPFKGNYQIVYEIPQTTNYAITEADPPTKPTNISQELGVPLDAAQVGVGETGLPLTLAVPALAKLNDLDGAAYDARTGRLILVGASNPNLAQIDPADLVVAFRSVYSQQEPAGVSIDPTNPNNPSGPMRVSYYGSTQDTHFGQVLFGADRYLKILSMGEDNETGDPVTSRVPGFQSELDLALQLGAGSQKPQWHRMWYLMPNHELRVRESADGRAMLFDDVPLAVEARFVEFDKNGNKHDVPGSDPATNQFVNHFNTHFADFAREKQEVAQLTQLAKMVAIARWLHDKDVPVDLAWLDAYPTKQNTVATTKGRTATKQNTQYEIQISGGVDFDFKVVPYVPGPDDSVHAFAKKIDSTSPFTVNPAPVYVDGADHSLAQFNLTRSVQPGALTYTQPILDVPTNESLPLELLLFYNSFNKRNTPFGQGWDIKFRKLGLEQRETDTIDGSPVELYATVNVLDPATSKQRRYTATTHVINDRVIYKPEQQGDNTSLAYQYREGIYSNLDGGKEYQFDKDGRLATISQSNENIQIRRDGTGTISELQHSGGASIQIKKDAQNKIRVTGSDGTHVTLDVSGQRLNQVLGPQGNIQLKYQDNFLRQLVRAGDNVDVRVDDLGRVLERRQGGLDYLYAYDSDGTIWVEIKGLPDKEVTVTFGWDGQIKNIDATTQIRTSDHQQALAAGYGIQDSASLLSNAEMLDLSWLMGDRFKTLVLKPFSKRAVEIEKSEVNVDGRLRADELQSAWTSTAAPRAQLESEHCEHITFDPASNTIAGVNPTTNEIVMFVQKDGTFVRQTYQGFDVSDAVSNNVLGALVTDRGAQANGVNVFGAFQTRSGWQMLTSNGEIKPFEPLDKIKAVSDIAKVEDADSRREQMKAEREILVPAIRSAFNIEYKVVNATNAQELVLEAYPPARELYGDNIPVEIQRQIEFAVHPGQVVKLGALNSPYGWLLPGDETYLFDVPKEMGYLVLSEFGLNKIRTISRYSTPLQIEKDFSQEKLRTAAEVVVVFTPHSEDTNAQASEERNAFNVVKTRAQELGIRVEDVGDNPEGGKVLLQRFADEKYVVFSIGHSGREGQLYVYKDSLRTGAGLDDIKVELDDIKVARDAKSISSCCAYQKDIPGALIRAGAKSVTATVEPVTLNESIPQLLRKLEYIKQHPNGFLLSEMEQYIRIQSRKENKGAGYEAESLPQSFDLNIGGLASS